MMPTKKTNANGNDMTMSVLTIPFTRLNNAGYQPSSVVSKFRSAEIGSMGISIARSEEL